MSTSNVVAAKIQASKGSLLVVNLRGLVNTREPVLKTLRQLHIEKRFNATIVPDNEMYNGMLKACKEHVAWCIVSAEFAKTILERRAEKSDGNRFQESDLKARGLSSFSELASLVSQGKARLDGTQGFRQFFRLNSPRGGFKRSIRRQFSQGGILGHNAELQALVEKMI